MLGLTFGAQTAKMPYGHRGGNHPVPRSRPAGCSITSQNHGFAVVGDEEGIPGAPELEVTHVNLNDGTVEGLRTARSRSSPCSIIRRRLQARTTRRPLFDEFLRNGPFARGLPSEPNS